MSEDYDISQIQVPEDFIQQILEQTSPLEEPQEEVHTPEATSPQDGKIVELLSLMFEEFDKINSRFDSLQEKINEMTGVGNGIGGGGYSVPPTIKKVLKKKKSRNESTDALAELLSKRLGR
jgi:tetrahydromethanopterin S-methyltransferase subunit G